MTFMPWSDDFRVGLDDIDEQHRWLFTATNHLYDEIHKENHSRAVIGEILEGLMDYTMNHFIIEEELFQRHGYPQAQAHKALHDKFTLSIMNTLTEFEAGKDIEKEVLEILKNWLIQHIMKTDSTYVPFLKQHSAKHQ